MSDTPRDPAQNTVDQQKSADETYDGQRGYGVEYEDGRYQSANMQQMPEGGHSGSYEEHNTGGYGSGQAPVAPPDPEAQQGQGGQ